MSPPSRAEAGHPGVAVIRPVGPARARIGRTRAPPASSDPSIGTDGRRERAPDARSSSPSSATKATWESSRRSRTPGSNSSTGTAMTAGRVCSPGRHLPSVNSWPDSARWSVRSRRAPPRRPTTCCGGRRRLWSLDVPQAADIVADPPGVVRPPRRARCVRVFRPARITTRTRTRWKQQSGSPTCSGPLCPAAIRLARPVPPYTCSMRPANVDDVSDSPPPPAAARPVAR